MFKINRFKTLVVLLTTILGLTGVTSTVYADKASDKKIVANMALTYSKYQTFTSLEALDWANKNMTYPALDNPYRFSIPGKSPLCIFILGAQISLGTTSILSYNANIKNVVFDKNHKNAYVVLKRLIRVKSTPAEDKVIYDMAEKIWFKKINNSWKISDYYMLLNDFTINGKSENPPLLRASAFGCNKVGFDTRGTEFPR